MGGRCWCVQEGTALGDELFGWEGWEAQAEIRKKPSKPSVSLGKKSQENGESCVR